MEKIAKAFRKEGHAFHLVGGYARDKILGVTSGDIDATTDARPKAIKSILRSVMSDGDSIYAVGERFGTIGAIIGGEEIEITTYRSEKYSPRSRKPEVIFGDSLGDDLARRDFTMNAIAIDPISGDTLDPFGGERDIKEGIVRAVGVAEDRLSEDPLRMLRAVRFCAKYGFSLADDLADAIEDSVPKMVDLSAERIRDELVKILMSPRPSYGLRMLHGLGLMPLVVPGVRDHEELFSVISKIPKYEHLRLAALFSRVSDAEETLKDLRFPGATISAVSHLVREYDKLPKRDDVEVRRFIRKSHKDSVVADDFIAIAAAEKIARGDHLYDLHLLAGEIIRVREESPVPIENLDSPIDGSEIIAMGVTPGPMVGKIKSALVDMVVDGKLAPEDKKGAVREAKKIIKKGK